MRIASVQSQLPSKIINNADILDAVMEHSRPLFQGDLEVLRASLAKLFDLAGCNERRVLADGEKPIQLMRQATERGLAESGWSPNDVELLIFVGIGKGFVEPANAYTTAQALGINKADCFDVVDACMSWTRALYIVKSLMETKQYSRVMLVNAEFNHTLYGYPDLLQFQDLSQIEHRFAGLTVGEATSVTCLSDDDDTADWRFKFTTRPDLADLCTIPNPSYDLFYDVKTDRVGKNGPYNFTSFGKEIHDEGFKAVIETFKQSGMSADDFSHVFTHASSGRAWGALVQTLGLYDRYYDIFPITGNIVSASLPTGLAMAKEAGKLKRGDHVLGLVGSAGMSFCAFSFHY